VEIEMVQAVRGRDPDTAVLGRRQGVSHIAYRVDDLPPAMARAEAAGLQRLCTYSSDQVDFSLHEGPALGGMLLQLVAFHGERS
jgi:hypothetical protein